MIILDKIILNYRKTLLWNNGKHLQHSCDELSVDDVIALWLAGRVLWQLYSRWLNVGETYESYLEPFCRWRDEFGNENKLKKKVHFVPHVQTTILSVSWWAKCRLSASLSETLHTYLFIHYKSLRMRTSSAKSPSNNTARAHWRKYWMPLIYIIWVHPHRLH